MEGPHLLLQRNNSATFCHLLGFGFWEQWQEGGAWALVSGLWEDGCATLASQCFPPLEFLICQMESSSAR